MSHINSNRVGRSNCVGGEFIAVAYHITTQFMSLFDIFEMYFSSINRDIFASR